MPQPDFKYRQEIMSKNPTGRTYQKVEDSKNPRGDKGKPTVSRDSVITESHEFTKPVDTTKSESKVASSGFDDILKLISTLEKGLTDNEKVIPANAKNLIDAIVADVNKVKGILQKAKTVSDLKGRPSISLKSVIPTLSTNLQNGVNYINGFSAPVPTLAGKYTKAATQLKDKLETLKDTLV